MTRDYQQVRYWLTWENTGSNLPISRHFSGRTALNLTDFGANCIPGARLCLKECRSPRLFGRILEDIAYQEYIDDPSEEGHQRWENVLELEKLASEYDDRGIEDFLERLALVSDQDTLAEGMDAPTLLTRTRPRDWNSRSFLSPEWMTVCCRTNRSLDDPEEMAEERRLLYVGITRAKERVYLTRADRRSTFGGYDDTTPSRFLRDIPSSLIIQQGLVSPADSADLTVHPSVFGKKAMPTGAHRRLHMALSNRRPGRKNRGLSSVSQPIPG
jgi:DNA helicase-2/ATP-dependent DNA helicase PcrA